MSGLSRLAAWHLPDGPVGPESRWSATSNVEVSQTTNPVNGGRVGREGQSYKEKERETKQGVERRKGQGLLTRYREGCT